MIPEGNPGTVLRRHAALAAAAAARGHAALARNVRRAAAPAAARAPPAPHAAASRAPAPVLLDYIKESHDWETSQTPFDYSQAADWLAEGVEGVRSQNPTMLPLLTRLRDFEFFRYFAVDLLAGCSYMPPQDEPCGLDACESDPVDDEGPDGMRERDEDEYEFELDAWARWDMPSDFTEYYDVTALGEGNTQYEGSRVGKFIHQKICFQRDLEALEHGWTRAFNRAIAGMPAAVDARSASRATVSAPWIA